MKTRTITAIIALSIFVPIVVLGSWPLLITVFLLAYTALYEILKMNRIHIFSIPGMLSMVALFIVMMPQESYMPYISMFQVDLIIVMALLMLSFTVISKNRFSFVDMGFCVLAVAYVGIGFMYFYETREEGIIYILYGLLIVWVTDTGALSFRPCTGKKEAMAPDQPQQDPGRLPRRHILQRPAGPPVLSDGLD